MFASFYLLQASRQLVASHWMEYSNNAFVFFDSKEAISMPQGRRISPPKSQVLIEDIAQLVSEKDKKVSFLFLPNCWKRETLKGLTTMPFLFNSWSWAL